MEPFTSGLYAFAVEVNGGASLVVDGIPIFDSLNEVRIIPYIILHS